MDAQETNIRDEGLVTENGDEEVQRGIRGETIIRADALRFNSPPTYTHERSYLFRYNPTVNGNNLKLMLNTIQQLTFFVSVYLYTRRGDYQVLFAPIISDLTLSVISFILLPKLGIATDEQMMILRRMKGLVFVLKVSMCYLIYLSTFGQKKWIPWVSLLIVLLLILTNTDGNKIECYESLFNFINLVSFTLFLFKYHGVWDLSWKSIFILYLIIGWIIFFICCIVALVLTLVFIASLCRGDFKAAITMMISQGVTISLFFFCSYCFALPVQMLGEEKSWLGLSLETTCLITIIINVISFFYGLLVSLFPHQSIILQPQVNRERQVKETRGLNTVLNVMQINPNYFAFTDAMKKDQKPEAGETEDQCAICYTNPPNCLIFPCLHAGLCKSCSVKIMSKRTECPMCRKPMEKISIIEKISDTEYKIVEEIKAV